MALRREIALLQQIDTVAPIGRLAVIVVLLHLARRDYVAAEKAFKEWGNYCEQPEVCEIRIILLEESVAKRGFVQYQHILRKVQKNSLLITYWLVLGTFEIVRKMWLVVFYGKLFFIILNLNNDSSVLKILGTV